MLKAIVCAACGAQVREDRKKCLRCGKPLVAAKPKTPPRVPANTMLLIGGCVLVVGFAGIMIATGSKPPVTEESAPATVVPRSSRPVTEVPKAAAPEFASLEASRNGVAAYKGGNVAGSLDQFATAVEANPDDPEAQNNLGQLLVRNGKVKDAIPHFDRAIALSEKTWAYHFNRARAYAQLGDWPKAAAGYRDAKQLFPDDYATEFNLAKALQASGDVTGAVDGFARAIQLAPGQTDFHLSYGLALEAAKRPRDAAAAYRKYLELEPGSADAEKIKARIAQLEGGAMTASAAS